jgi:hypothetical protein
VPLVGFCRVTKTVQPKRAASRMRTADAARARPSHITTRMRPLQPPGRYWMSSSDVDCCFYFAQHSKSSHVQTAQTHLHEIYNLALTCPSSFACLTNASRTKRRWILPVAVFGIALVKRILNGSRVRSNGSSGTANAVPLRDLEFGQFRFERLLQFLLQLGATTSASLEHDAGPHNLETC